MNQTELDKILEEHKLWLDSFGEKGKQADLREADLRGADLRETNLLEADLSGADLRKVNLNEADLIVADLRGAYLSGADLRKANLIEANLSGADLSGANLSRADLNRADLSRADLSKADLRRADLSFNSTLIKLELSEYTICYQPSTGWTQIGCEEHNLDYWLENYTKIGEENNYSKIQIEEYFLTFKYLKQLKELYDGKN